MDERSNRNLHPRLKNGELEDIVRLVLGIFLILVGAGLVFTGIGIIGSIFCWWFAYELLS